MSLWLPFGLLFCVAEPINVTVTVLLQTFKRQVQALGQQGMAILHETPSYAFLLACQNIAARQQSSSEDTPPQAAGPAHSADPSTGSMSNQPSSSYAGSGMNELHLRSASLAACIGAADAAAATAQGAAAAAAAAPRGSVSAGDVSMSIGYDDEDVQAVMDAINPSLASEVSCACTCTHPARN